MMATPFRFLPTVVDIMSGKQRGTGVGEEIPHIQGQRNPSKTLEGVNLHLESNPIPTRDAMRTQTNVVCTRTQEPLRD